jgi:predicted site-specific integrase-resolvase
VPIPTIDDPSLNAGDAARFWGVSIVTLNRNIREGRHPPADFTNGPYRFWKLSTLVRARERRIAESAHETAALRRAQLKAAEHARVERQRKRAEQAATASLTETDAS